jgi:hypothetical protein
MGAEIKNLRTSDISGMKIASCFRLHGLWHKCTPLPPHLGFDMKCLETNSRKRLGRTLSESRNDWKTNTHIRLRQPNPERTKDKVPLCLYKDFPFL